MAFGAAFTDQAKQDFLSGLYQTSDTYKIALGLQSSATTWNKSIVTYTTSGELATANGYTQGGITIATYTVGLSGDTAYVDWTVDPQWTSSGAGFTSDCAMIYNSTRSNHVLCVLSFGSTTASGGGTFTVQLPVPGASATMTIV
jgi:hypothetical protein